MYPNFAIYLNQQKKVLPKTKKVNIYVCGPTVYNHIHIGNARPLIIFDVMYRLLKFLGYDVEYVQNATDIDDKIVAAAQEQNIPETVIAKKYLREYNKICKALNAFNFSQELVTNNIPQIVDFINRLVEKKYAYIQDDSIYFDVGKIKNYGEHSGRVKKSSVIGKKNKIESKRNSEDFALWKATEGGLRWDSLWEPGRPGWHTECVTMIEKRFGKDLTIHGGGIDLKFPHHENEIAQFYALYKRKLGQLWVYVGHVMVEDEKMSKSLKNFIYVKDILQKYEPNALRWWFLNTNFQLPIKYDQKSFESIYQDWKRVVNTINKAKSYIYLQDGRFKKNKNISKICIEKLANGLDSANFVTEIQKIVKTINTNIKANKFDLLTNDVNELENTLKLVGFKLKNIHSSENIQLLKEWKKKLDAKDYAQADEIRNKLIQLELI